ncbi:MAG: methionine adenosyltransferase [Clostridiales bacterium]|nr:methionine adenosyltransferase [Clostridiales bacterium]
MKRIITSESVNIGHPDKTCDILADSFLDEALKSDKNSMMAVECAIKDNNLFIYGEATTNANINYEQIAREKLKEIGYTCNFNITQAISEQSREINHAVLQNEITANDQGIVYGYATIETENYMPLPITIAHQLMEKYNTFQKENNYFCPDAKSQVSIEYDGTKAIRVHTILVSVSHTEDINNEKIREEIMKSVISPVLLKYSHLLDNETKYIINPSGSFTIWGSFSDSGCVGRKIVVDTYGGIGRVGGGCFSSKNPTKIDRSGAYYARYVAKSIVASGLADKLEIQVSYAIGISHPLSIYIDAFGTNKLPLDDIEKIIMGNFDFSVGNIIDELDLLEPIYSETACFGHFGKDKYSWEKIKPLKY